MFNNIEAVIFDLDGTLVDSMWIWLDIDIEYLKRKNVDVDSIDHLKLQKDIEGMSYTEVALYFKDTFNLEDSIEQIKADWLDMTREFYAEKILLKEGVKELLDNIKDNELKLGVATSNTRELVDAVLKNNEIHDYFEIIRTSCEVEKGKPHPHIYLKVAEDLGVDPQNCLAFEDTHAGVLAAKSAGMKVFAIADETSLPFKEDIMKDADRYLNGYHEIA
ncbi:MAG: HAD family phosphatase [Anaeromicrobium sp.]|uniref:HAD family hydrolase n=1 Tax=Anaeromicrobium sp. TaxID=1929132 RepID=UPI0025D650E4|nr:HAD family phosphatase [Anaeromicrobium sp.]MCT4596018.1 HAD family phosphatase [Anaeromicrobium sp.]